MDEQTMKNKAMTLTFGDQAENHVGMEILGEAADDGFNLEDLMRIKDYMDALGYGDMVELIDLREIAASALPKDAPEPEAAYVMVLRKFLTNERATRIFKENLSYEWDKKLWNARQKKVQNKHARYNVCFDDVGRDADYENGKGTVVSWSDVPDTHAVHRALPVLLGEKGKGLVCEGNLYYDVKKTGIGWHGDSERKKVVGLRFGESIPLKFKWWWRAKSFGETKEIMLNHGDAYIMSEKTVGWDWKNSVKYGPTLRHSAGSEKYTKN